MNIPVVAPRLLRRNYWPVVKPVPSERDGLVDLYVRTSDPSAKRHVAFQGRTPASSVTVPAGSYLARGVFLLPDVGSYERLYLVHGGVDAADVRSSLRFVTASPGVAFTDGTALDKAVPVNDLGPVVPGEVVRCHLGPGFYPGVAVVVEGAGEAPGPEPLPDDFWAETWNGITVEALVTTDPGYPHFKIDTALNQQNSRVIDITMSFHVSADVSHGPWSGSSTVFRQFREGIVAEQTFAAVMLGTDWSAGASAPVAVCQVSTPTPTRASLAFQVTERLSNPHGIVVDPFTHVGTTVYVRISEPAVSLWKRFVGQFQASSGFEFPGSAFWYASLERLDVPADVARQVV